MYLPNIVSVYIKLRNELYLNFIKILLGSLLGENFNFTIDVTKAEILLHVPGHRAD